jgi:hypothetical protein
MGPGVEFVLQAPIADGGVGDGIRLTKQRYPIPNTTRAREGIVCSGGRTIVLGQQRDKQSEEEVGRPANVSVGVGGADAMRCR